MLLLQPVTEGLIGVLETRFHITRSDAARSCSTPGSLLSPNLWASHTTAASRSSRLNIYIWVQKDKKDVPSVWI
ncbi:hypothetical protein MHYP_G00023900 [Metynnis hypsauchen]